MQIDAILNGFYFDDKITNRIAKQFEAEMEMALDDQLEGTSLLCENTYIPELPNGTGTYNQYVSTIDNECLID